MDTSFREQTGRGRRDLHSIRDNARIVRIAAPSPRAGWPRSQVGLCCRIVIADFTDFVRSLAAGKELDAEVYRASRELIRVELTREMMRRGLLDLPPRFLGLTGKKWSRDLLDELVSDCYQDLFVFRLGSLKNQLLVRNDINGLVVRAVRNFLHDRQRENDPLGFQLYQILAASVRRSEAAGKLRVAAGVDEKIHNGTLLVFSTEPRSAKAPRDLDPVVRTWSSRLWPGLITARGPARRGVLAALDACVARLAEQGVEACRFGDLLVSMKADFRLRWRGELDDLAETALGASETGHSLGFRSLRACVLEGIGRVTEARREDLRKLWNFLCAYAAGLDRSELSARAERGGRPPSDLGLEKELEIPRHRISGLKKELGRLIQACQRPAAVDGEPYNEVVAGLVLPPVRKNTGGPREVRPPDRNEPGQKGLTRD